jgi:hypothetical protein
VQPLRNLIALGLAFAACALALAACNGSGRAATSTRAPASGARDQTQWPFSVGSPWNTPLGNRATFSRPFLSSGECCPSINYQSYSVPIYQASANDPEVTITASSGTNPGAHTTRIPVTAMPANGSDMHMVVIAPDHESDDEWWELNLATHTAGVYLHVDLTGSGVGIGYVRATGVSLMGGLIRSAEINADSIPHVLAMGAPGGLTGKTCPIWPAITCDAAGEGALVAIPPGTPEPAGLSPLGAAIFDALRRYGAYNVDQTGGGAVVFYAEQSGPDELVPIALARVDLQAITPLLRIVTNDGPSAVGGPGKRMAALAPAPLGAYSARTGP